MMKKRGWRKDLGKMILDQGRQPFKWGVNDCMTLASRSVEIITGNNPMEGWPKYSDKHEAIKVVNDRLGLGFMDTFAAVFKKLGFKKVTGPSLGDIVFIKTENLDPEANRLFGGVTLATVVSETGHVLCPGREGLVILARYELEVAWKL